ncbi:MAG: PAS domain-containing protein [Anaerolineae bacterium]|nr:PAS domain-containing protein [Anaerolineae bacterium]
MNGEPTIVDLAGKLDEANKRILELEQTVALLTASARRGAQQNGETASASSQERPTQQSGIEYLDASQLLQSVLDTIPARIFWKDHNLVYLGSNRVFAQDAGFESPEEIVGKSDYEMGWHDQAEQYRSDDQAVIDSGIPKINYEEPQTTPDGSKMWLETSKIPLVNTDGKIIGVLGTYADITPRKLIEEEREELLVKLEKTVADLQVATRIANENARLKSEFLATMSHELRTPMNAIEGFTSIMLSKMGGVEYNDKTARYVQRVNANSKRLLALINDFLDLSRIESGRMELANMPFSPQHAATRWKEEIDVLAQKKNLKFDIEIDPNVPETVYGDEEAISKVALNLLSNAIKFTETGEVSLKMEGGDQTWSIVVTDTGIGIPLHAREFIFEEFRQVDQSSKRKYGGTGLGLAIAQRFVRSMGGTITVKSEVGAGSTFTVSLPVSGKTELVAEVSA